MSVTVPMHERTAEPTRPTSVTIIREALTYERGAPRSYFADLVLGARGDNAANARLRRHTDEMTVELERRRTVPLPDKLEVRTNPNRIAGQGGNFAPPLWLINEFATAPRTSRIISALTPNFELPAGVQSVSVPRLTTGALVSPTNDLAATPSRDLTGAEVKSPVVMIAGQEDVSLQVLEQSPPGAHFDWAVLKDLSESYDANLERQLLTGTGINGQLAGLVTSTSNTITYTDATPTGSEMFPFLGQAVAAVGTNRKRPPERWLATSARWAWLGTSEDTVGNPLTISNHDGDHPDGRIGYILGFPVNLNDAIPLTINGNQDTVIAYRPSDMLLLESTPRASVMLEPLSGVLEARITFYCYVAALVGRYPTGIAVLSGTGMVPVTGF